VETASAIERTAKDAPQDEQRTSTTYSLGCWVKEFPPLKNGVSLGTPVHIETTRAFVLLFKSADGSRRLVCGLATATRSRLAAARVVC
jgi:hypothetical protein